MNDLNYHRQVLGVTKDSSISDIKKAYRKQAKEWHPDRFYNDAAKHRVAEEKIKEINLAYELLIQCENGKNTVSFSSKSSTGVRVQKVDPSSFYNQAVVIAESGKKEESLDLFAKAIKLRPNYLEALEYRYKVLLELGFEYRATADAIKIRELKNQTSQNKAATPKTSSGSPESPSTTVEKPTATQKDSSQTSSNSSQNSPTSEIPTSTKASARLFKQFSYTTPSITGMVVDRYRRLITIGKNQTIQIFQLGSYKPVGTLDYHTKTVRSIDLNSAQDLLLTAGDDTTAQVFDLSKNKNIASLKKSFLGNTLPKIKQAYFSSETNCAVLIGDDESIRKWNYKENKISYSKENKSKIVLCSISQNRKYLALLDNQSMLKLRDVTTGKIVRSIKFEKRLTSIGLSRKGNLIAVVTIDQKIQIWDITQKILLKEFQRHFAKIVSLKFFEEKNRLISFSSDGVIKMWPLEKKGEVITLSTNYKSITGYAFMDKNRMLTVGSQAGYIFMYRLNL